MDHYYLLAFLGYSIGIAAIIGVVRYRKILSAYHPFVYIICFAFMAELLNTLTANLLKNTAYITNTYALLESILYVKLFHNWGALRSRSWHYACVVVFLLLLWAWDILFWHKFISFSSFFLISYAFLLIFLAINQVSKMIVQEQGNILRSAKFLICAGIIVFYTFNATIQVFFLFRVKVSNTFYQKIYLVIVFVNLFVNLVYALAALWIPTRQRFSASS